MRLIYLDESGTSANEHVTAVAGVILDYDTQIVRVEETLGGLIERFVPVGQQAGFAFHATELFSGAKKGRPFSRVTTDSSVRWPILEEVAKIPLSLELPILIGTISDETIAKLTHLTDEQRQNLMHSLAYIQALVAAEKYMRGRADGEYALVIAENKARVRRWLKTTHAIIQNEEYARTILPPPIYAAIREHLPITRIRDTVHFAEKSESRPLQLADVCAFVLRRYAENAQHNDRFVDALFTQDAGVALPRGLPELRLGGIQHHCFHLAPRPPSAES